MKVLSDYLWMNNPKPDFKILGLIFNASYHWLVKDPNSLDSWVSDLKKAL